MSEIWAAAIAAAGAVGAAAISANSQKKAAAAQNAALAGAQQLPTTHVPFPTLVNSRKAAQNSTGYNLGNLSQSFNLANQVNAFQDRQAVRGYNFIQPYYQQLQAQLGKNALSFAKGELPADVVASIGREAASRGLQNGFGQGSAGGQGSLGMLNLRNLGLNSLQLSQYGNTLGMQLASAAAAQAPGLFDVSSTFVTPGLDLAAQQFNAGAINQTNQLNAGYANAANTQNVGLANAILQQQGQNSAAASEAAAKQYASAASTIGGLAANYFGSQSGGNSGSFYGSQAAAQQAIPAGTGATVTNSQYGYAIRPQTIA